MPFRHLELDLATREQMTAAYDAARQQLGIGTDDPRTAILAMAIIKLVETGLRDPAALCEQAVAALQAQAAKSGRKRLLRRVRNAAAIPPMSPDTRS